MKATDRDTTLAEHVIQTMAYFDIFHYPLLSEEVFHYLQAEGVTPTQVQQCLDDLTDRKQIFRFGDLYSLQAEQQNAERRLKGNREAGKWLAVARKQARLIARFPFVRAVMASGSLSKGYMDEKSDLDFFIVTAPGRLWVARTLLVLYKRVFLFNSHKKFCVNYFVDTQHLEIEEKNLFTATELVTLIPFENRECYDALLASNQWLREYLPNFKCRDTDDVEATRMPWISRLVEFLLNPIAAPFDRFLMRVSLRRWRILYEKKFDRNQFEIAFKTRDYVSKNHPNNYQKKILDQYQLKVMQYSKQSGRGV